MPVARLASAAFLSLFLIIAAISPVLGRIPDADGATGSLTAPLGLEAVNLQPGDVVRDNGIAVVVPDAGDTVWGSLEFADGTFQELQITTSADGAVRLFGLGNEALLGPEAPSPSAISYAGSPTAAASAVAGPTAAAGSGSSECSDRRYSLFSWRYPSFRWRFNANSLPRKFKDRADGQEQVLRALRRANENITRSNNICGRGDRSSATMDFIGYTDRQPDISGAYCSKPDGVNVIGFGNLPSRSIAYACVHSNGSRYGYDGDIKINREWNWETRLRQCNRELLIEAGMTHEFGHIYGLAHVGGYSLTMQPTVGYCSRAKASLGLGDMIGLERKY